MAECSCSYPSLCATGLFFSTRFWFTCISCAYCLNSIFYTDLSWQAATSFSFWTAVPAAKDNSSDRNLANLGPRNERWQFYVPLPSCLVGLGKRHKLPQRGPWWSPGFSVFGAWKNTSDSDKFDINVIIIIIIIIIKGSLKHRQVDTDIYIACAQGIFVSRVVNGGPCDEAGLCVGDKLLSVSLAFFSLLQN